MQPSPDDLFPPEITALPVFDGPFAAHRLAAPGCQVLFASYPAGTVIETHDHPTKNAGVVTKGRLYLTQGGRETAYGSGEWYRIPAGGEHAARFDVETAVIEFWFTTS